MSAPHAAWPGNYLNPDGTLRILEWALRDVEEPPFEVDHHLALQLGGRVERLGVETSRALPTRMAHSTATGRGLLTNGQLGVDLIRLGAGEAFVPHTHPGDHLLIVVGGKGTITVSGGIYPTRAGQVYMVEGRVPHAVGAITDHVILAVGAPHKAVDDAARMTPVEYQDVLASIEGHLTCHICGVWTAGHSPIHEQGCPHCPCPLCSTTGDAAEDAARRRHAH